MVTYTKLRSGDWGLKGSASEIKEGQFATVKRMEGGNANIKVGRILWTGNGISIATLATKKKKKRFKYQGDLCPSCKKDDEHAKLGCSDFWHNRYDKPEEYDE